MIYDPNSQSQKRANALAAADADMVTSLVQMRVERGLSREDVARTSGLSIEIVRDLENTGDAMLSQVRRYAHTICAYVTHQVSDSPQQDAINRVRDLHQPEAKIDSSEGGAPSGIGCVVDGEEYPCSTIKAL